MINEWWDGFAQSCAAFPVTLNTMESDRQARKSHLRIGLDNPRIYIGQNSEANDTSLHISLFTPTNPKHR